MAPPYFRRRTAVLSDSRSPQMTQFGRIMAQNISARRTECASIVDEPTVLIVNSSHAMAKGITSELSVALPGASLIYAPTLALAKLLIKRREIDLIVSAPILPDGNISQLQESLRQCTHQPDIVVVGDISLRNTEIMRSSGYAFKSLRRLGSPARTTVRPQPLAPKKSAIKALGADIRNDLNNPLQEIVAMVFVAKAGSPASPTTAQALEAIDRAAKSMANVVQGLEEKIAKLHRSVPIG